MHAFVCSNQCYKKREVGVYEQLSWLPRIALQEGTVSPP